VSRHGPWNTFLANADSLANLAPIARALGFTTPAPLDDATRQALGIPDEFRQPHLAEGTGATRALLAVVNGDHSLREHVGRLAGKLVSRAPHLLWLALLTSPTRGELVVATWTAARIPPKVVALFVDRAHVLTSDVDTITAIAGATGANDVVIHARWHELLGREAVSRRFFQALQRLVAHLARARSAMDDVAHAEDRDQIALLHVSRLLFLSFLETKGWLDGDRGFLTRVFDDCMARGGSFQQRVLWPLFFGTLNTRPRNRAAVARSFGRIPFLNGGLFHRSPAETRARRWVIRDEDWGRVYDELLQRYRFTAREESADWSEAAIDPEMLGRAFESLMASADRRRSGAFFTPQVLVERVTEAALHALLEQGGVAAPALDRALRGEELEAGEKVRVREVLHGLRLLDPACGSGAFLVHVLERVTTLRRSAGDTRPAHRLRRDVLTGSLFGVDVNPTAVWLCELRLWLAVVMDHQENDPLQVTPLPNLDHNVRCGDALAGGDFDTGSQMRGHMGQAVAALRSRYARATASRKRTLARVLEREERALARAWLERRLRLLAEQRRALLTAARGRDLFGGRRGTLAGEHAELASLRNRAREVRTQLRAVIGNGPVPFAFAAHFSDVAAHGGFDVVIGNPPWVRLHRIAPDLRDRLRREFRVFREAAWEAGAHDARAGRGFAAQVDLASLFVERGMALTRPNGVLALLVPAKLSRSLAGGGVRRLLHERHALRVVEDWSDAPAVFDAVVYPSLVVAHRRAESQGNEPRADVRVTAHRGTMAITWTAPHAALPLDASRGAPWLTLPPDARAAFDRLTRAGVALVRSGIGQPTLGVKCGCNDAFLVRHVAATPGWAVVGNAARTAEVEADCVRPALRGEHVRAWRVADTGERIVYPCGDDGRVLKTLPAGVRDWLLPFRRQLEERADARGGSAWWSLFRTEGARCAEPRVVWADVARTPQALILAAGDRTVPINSCYVLRCRDLDDAFALATLLNSSLTAAWLAAIAEPARGGYRRFLAWTVARLPVPDNWDRARDILSPLGERGFTGHPPSRFEVLEAVLDAYRVRLRSVAPLLGWMSR
jgi:hypothetical protein